MHSESVDFDSVIIRYGGEIGIKRAWTRRVYERRLLDNIKNVLKHYGVPYDRVARKYGRLFLKTSSAAKASFRLARVFGISSVSPALETTSHLSDVVDKSVFLAGSVIHEGNSFAVNCRRVGNHPYASQDVCRQVGRRILQEFPKRGLRVDLEKPDVRLGVEIRDDEAFVYSSVIDGAGGFPLGTQPRLVGLLSGGMDSAVATWLVMKRGTPVVPVYFDNAPYTDETTTKRALNVAKALFEWAIGFPSHVYIVQHGPNLKEFMEACPRRLTCLLCKRMMYRVAECIAEKVGVEGIVTGESIGEQASQTIRNLRVLSSAVQKYPIHRPLLGFDKTETERIARRIGTYEPSSQKAKGCTAAPRKPATLAKSREVAEAEEKLNIEEMVKESLKTLRIVNSY